jgi:hypothetical protein
LRVLTLMRPLGIDGARLVRLRAETIRAALIRHLYDAVWMHGDQLVYGAVTEYGTDIAVKLRRWRGENHEESVRRRAVVQESLSAVYVVQAYSREDYEFERFRREAGSLESEVACGRLAETQGVLA